MATDPAAERGNVQRVELRRLKDGPRWYAVAYDRDDRELTHASRVGAVRTLAALIEQPSEGDVVAGLTP